MMEDRSATRGPRVLIMVLATDKQLWSHFQEVQQATWGTDLPATVTVMSYFKTIRPGRIATAGSRVREALRFGRRGVLQRTGDRLLNAYARRRTPTAALTGPSRLEIPVPDVIHWNGVATIAALDWAIKNREFDYVLRVNSSAYVNPTALATFIDGVDHRALVYAGNVEPGALFWGVDFVNGAAILMNRALVLGIVANARRWDHRFTDDVALGVLAGQLGASPIAMSVPRITSEQDILRMSQDEACRPAAFRLRGLEPTRDEGSRLLMLHALVRGA